MEEVTLDIHGSKHTNSATNQEAPSKAKLVTEGRMTIDLSNLHRVKLEAYATELGMPGPFDEYETRGDLIEAILSFREQEGMNNG